MKRLFYVLVSMLVVSCGDFVVTEDDASFYVKDDAAFDEVMMFFNRLRLRGYDDTDYRFKGNVKITIDKDNLLPKEFCVTDSETGFAYYKSNSTWIADSLCRVEYELYNPRTQGIISDFSGIMFSESAGNIFSMSKDTLSTFRKELKRDLKEHSNDYKHFVYEGLYDRIESGETHMYDGHGNKLFSVLADDEFYTLTEYWSNGQEKMIRKLNKVNRRVVSAENFTEDGRSGCPLPIYTLLNDRWAVFSSNLTYASQPVYLYLKADANDNNRGKVSFIASKDPSSSFSRYREGKYEINDNGRVRIYGMKNMRDLYFDASGAPFSMRMEGDLNGTYAIFTRDVSADHEDWVKNKLNSYGM